MIKSIYLLLLWLLINSQCICSDGGDDADDLAQSVAKVSLNPWDNLPMDVTVRDVRYDETFKILFGEEGGEGRTISFLNAVLKSELQDDYIESIKFLDGTMNSAVDRTIHFDVKVEATCTTHKGNRFIIEMQKARIPGHTNRWVYYGARELSQMGERNYKKALAIVEKEERKKAHRAHYRALDPVKVITILDFDEPVTQREMHNSQDLLVHWDICERVSKEIASPLLSWTYVMLPRFKREFATQLQQRDFSDDPLGAWLFLMTREDEEKVRVTDELVARDKHVAEGFHRVSHLTTDETESLFKGKMAFMSRMSREEERYEEGKEEGRTAERQENIRFMLTMGVPSDKICAQFKISIDALEQIRTAQGTTVHTTDQDDEDE